jgi:Zn-dependent peptidase ImmA (M78 family)
MTDRRHAILKGKREAARLHREFGMRERIEEKKGGRIDVFDTIVKCGIPLLFKPLDGLLGVFIDDPIPGVMVTTKRGLSVQRFTAAHELGHCRLGHSPSLDDEAVLQRSPFSPEGDDRQQELEANAFATEFMVPPWLFAAHFQRHDWTPAMMSNPVVAYQLSLRIGASYEATCRSLMRKGVEVIKRQTLSNLLEFQPRAIKKSILGEYEPPDFVRDVWLLTAKDENTVIEGSRSDLFVLKLTEHSGAGYIWTFDEINRAGFAIVRDEREGPDGESVGDHVTRSITAVSEMQQTGRMVLAERRPWMPNSDPREAFCVHYDLTGPEDEGLSQAERRLMLEAA